MRRVKESDNVFDTIKYYEFCINRLEKRIERLERKVALVEKNRGRKVDLASMSRKYVRALKKALDEHD